MDLIESACPWWEKGGERQDPDLVRAAKEPLMYDPAPFSLDDLRRCHVYTLRGPRRAGKTVALKKLIVTAISQGVPGRKFFWYAADTARTLNQLEQALRLVVGRVERGLAERDPIPPVLMVDEITSVNGWQRVIKKLRDDGTLGSWCVILTGSSSADIRRGAERMPGRRRDVDHPDDPRALDRCLLPMDLPMFRDQLERRLGAQLPANLLRLFFQVGGYPHRVGGCIRRMEAGQPDEEGVGSDDLLDVVIGEYERRGLNRAIVLEILSRLSVIGAHATSWEAFAKPLQAASRDTIKSYIQMLGDAFLLAIVHSYDTSRHRVALKRDRKLVWMDPSLAHLAAFAKVGEAPPESVQAEHAVGAALVRAWEPSLVEGVAFNRVVFTWKSSSGKEIDFVVVPGPKIRPLPVEVKYQQTIADWDFQVMERAFGNGILVTKETSRVRPKSRAVSLADFLLREATLN